MPPGMRGVRRITSALLPAPAMLPLRGARPRLLSAFQDRWIASAARQPLGSARSLCIGAVRLRSLAAPPTCILRVTPLSWRQRTRTFKEKARAVMLMPAACMPRAWYSVGMKKPLTVTEFARMGGKARAEKLSKEQLSAIGKKGGRPRLDKTTHSTPNS